MSLAGPHAASSLRWFGSLCDFMLEVSLAYCLCWTLARFCTSAAVRFSLWILFLLGSTTCWVLMLLIAFAPSLDGLKSVGPGAAAHLEGSLQLKLPGHAASDWIVSASAADALGHALPLLGLLYLLTLGALAAVALYRQRQLREALQFRTSPAAALGRAFKALALEMGVGACQLWLLPALPSPATTGWRTPCIYLPPECAEEDGLALENILRHELAHVRRRDTAWEAAARLCRAVLFFHPALHAAFAALHLERELACDLIVLRAQPEKRDVYADVLVRFGWRALAPGKTRKIGISFAASAAVLHARVQAILAGESTPSAGALTLRTLLSTCAFCLAGLLAPAVWIGFHLPPSPPAMAMAPVAESTRSARQSGRQLRVLSRPGSASKSSAMPLPALLRPAFAASAVPASALGGATLLPAIEAAPLRDVQYHNEPAITTPVYVAQEHAPDEDSAGQPTSAGRRKRGRGVSATAVTAVIGAAIALHGLLDHDHGHD